MFLITRTELQSLHDRLHLLDPSSSHPAVWCSQLKLRRVCLILQSFHTDHPGRARCPSRQFLYGFSAGPLLQCLLLVLRKPR
jgi:hypothetical protein